MQIKRKHTHTHTKHLNLNFKIIIQQTADKICENQFIFYLN
jgi:hypothetical protein